MLFLTEVTDMTTTKTILTVAGITLGAVLGAGCEEGPVEGPAAPDAEASEAAIEGRPAEAAEAAPEVRPGEASVLELERILRRIERGTPRPSDLDELARLVAEASLPAASLDQASLGLSKAREAAGDVEGAVEAVEELLKRHGGEPSFEAHETAVRRLRRLLVGSEEAPPTFARNMETMAPVAKVLARLFPEDDRGVSLVDVVSVGRPPTQTDPHGIFNVGRAKRELAEEACAVCETTIKAQRTHGRIDSWAELPLAAGELRADMPNPDRSLVVVYFDLVENRVPARYDAYLAVPSEETVARLERGEAFVAARVRPGKKPLLLLASPRAGQLDAVEQAFAAMTELPTTPSRVEVSRKLLPQEIQGVVRGGFRHFRVCYEALLANDPKAAGKVTAKFRIDGEGVPTEIGTDSTFDDRTLGTCIAEQFAALRFPASGEATTVTYPIAFSP